MSNQPPQILSATIEIVPISGLSLHPENPRRGAVEEISKSIVEHGQYRPIVVQRSSGFVLAGNHTLMAAREVGMAEIAVTYVDVDDAEARRILLVDNRIADAGTYDDATLLSLLRQSESEYGSLAGTGYDDDAFDALELAVEPPELLPAPDEDIPTIATPFSKTGDVWICGPHRVACGSSTDPEIFSKLLDDNKVDLIWTDPPYGVAYVGKTADELTIENDAIGQDLELLLGEAFANAVRYSKLGAVWYVSAPPGPQMIATCIVLTDMEIWRQGLVWVKNTLVMGHSDYQYKHEVLFYGWTPGAAHRTSSDRTLTSVFEVDKPSRSADHPTMKPLELIRQCIENSSDVGDVILDPFGGSGSTLLAAAMTGRVARLIELDPTYVDVICRRWQEASGVVPVLERTGKPHNFLKA